MPAGGGLLQLVATGKEDIFLFGNPQKTFFKKIFMRHTNFAIESMAMYFDGTPNFGQRVTCVVPRLADLLGQVYIDVTLPRLTLTNGTPVSYVNSIGHALIQEVSLEIGEQEIDRQTGEFMEVWTQLITSASQRDALNAMIGRNDGFSAPNFIPGTASGGLRLHIPLRFFFCQEYGVNLPLLALQFHPVRINLKLAPLQSLWWSPLLLTDTTNTLQVNNTSITNMMLWGDYVYLDVEERRRFVSAPQEYLIQQVQYTPPIGITANQNTATIQADFNHPVREFIFMLQRDFMDQVHEPFNYSNLAVGEALDPALLPSLQADQVRTDLLGDAVLQLDGYDRFSKRNAFYFRVVQPYKYHTTTPIDSFIYNYCFAVQPEDLAPSGSLNASRVDTIIWQLNMNPLLNTTRGNCHARIYATNHNVLRIVEGYGGVLFTI
jgi:hypothetical protein